MIHFDFQFYPTPMSLARKAWSKFQNKDFRRVLEPSAGCGDLLKAYPGYNEYRGQSIQVDCCEIDASKHALLRDMPGVTVVGLDFKKFGGCSIYSHVIMNPPFAQGVQHVLRAWDGLFSGEIVAIINAETVRNPFSAERQHLVRLIEQHGSVEFVEDAFAGDEAMRKTNVEVALVYLNKRSCVGNDITRKVLEVLKQEDEEAAVKRLAADFEEQHQLALPNSFVENQVVVFNAAVKAMRQSVVAEAIAAKAEALIGKEVAALFNDNPEEFVAKESKVSEAWVSGAIRERYLSLKERAWANLLRSANVEDKLSSAAQKRMRAAFDEIKTLEFTVENIHAFLRGLVESQGEIFREMACDVFDLITRYHTDNVVFYKGWASNDRHRSCGMRLKKTRFVLPGNLSYAGSNSLSYEASQRLRDFDKVLSVLDGKSGPEVSIESLFGKQGWEKLSQGERLSSTYMDIRFYPRAGTIHFFPRSQALMDKLNMLVGLQRQWLPPQTEAASEDFMKQYQDADRFDKELRERIAKSAKRHVYGDNPLREVFSRDCAHKAHEAIYAALTDIHASHGIKVDFQLQSKRDENLAAPQQLLLVA